MTVGDLRKKVREWDSQNVSGDPIADAKYTIILNQIEYHAHNDWRVFSPAEHIDENSNYMERLASWIGNLPSDTDQKTLLEYALYITFFSYEDFTAFYQTALNRDVATWIAAQRGANLSDLGGRGYHDSVSREIHLHTWYCPITDSMLINEFCKVNRLQGVRHHPNFDDLQKMSLGNAQTAETWIRYMASPDGCGRSLTRLVLLEDIVGSGNQCMPAVRWALESLDVPVLFIPLIICPNGLEALRAEEGAWGGRLAVRPVIELQRSDLLGPESRDQNSWPLAKELEELVTSCRGRLTRGLNVFGYEGTGCSMVKYTNTPDNTLPIVHHRPLSGAWEPLFPRVFRD